jgi:arylsulfatase A-like enzyme
VPLYELTLHLDHFPSAADAAEFSNEVAVRGWSLAPAAPGQPGLASRFTRMLDDRQALDEELEQLNALAPHPMALAWGELTSGRGPHAR